MESSLSTATKEDISTLFSNCREILESVSNSGYTLMVNFSIMGYEHFECTFDEAWKEQYDAGNYLLEDPVFRWALSNEGEARWSEIDLPDPLQILKKSQRYGLTFGAAFSALTGARRSMVFVSRSDRELTDQEMYEVRAATSAFFNRLLPPPKPTTDELNILRLLIHEDLSYSEIADRLCISLSGVKSRFLRLREKYDCGSNASLCYKAKELNLLGVDSPTGQI